MRIGTFESKYEQSIAVLDTQTGALSDFPDDRTAQGPSSRLSSPDLAFSRDGKHIYASMASLTDPLGGVKDSIGSGMVVYSFSDGKIAPERIIILAAACNSPPGSKTKLLDENGGDKGVPFSSCDRGGWFRRTLRDSLSPTISPTTFCCSMPQPAQSRNRFDLSESDAVPSTYPIALAVTKDGARAFVALWNSSEIVELDLAKKT